MGSGSYSKDDFISYSSATKRDVAFDSLGRITNSYSEQDVFKQTNLSSALNPYNIMRECCDTEEHPNTIPVILALDVTGSMGSASLEVAKSLNVIMENLYKNIKDIEFCIMGIGDMAYDRCPVQMSQFESDIRIAENVDAIYHEHGGGGNSYESYSFAWYMGLHHTSLDCWKRDKKGIIITLGDENLNPYIPIVGYRSTIMGVLGDDVQGTIETKDLYEEASKKFDIYHIHVSHSRSSDMRERDAVTTFSDVIGTDNVKVATLETLSDTIVDIIVRTCENSSNNSNSFDNNLKTTSKGIAWV